MQWQISPGSPSGTLPKTSLIRRGEFYESKIFEFELELQNFEAENTIQRHKNL